MADRTPEWAADEIMSVAASRLLRDGMSCFVGIGIPSTGRQPGAQYPRGRTCSSSTKRGRSAPSPTACRCRSVTASWRKPPIAVVSGARNLQLLAARRSHRRRLPVRRPDRPVRQPEHHGDRPGLPPAEGAPTRSGRCSRDRRPLPRSDGDHAPRQAGLRAKVSTSSPRSASVRRPTPGPGSVSGGQGRSTSSPTWGC